MLNGRFRLIDILQVKYLNNIIEQNNRFIKKIACPIKDFKAFHSVSAKQRRDQNRKHDPQKLIHLQRIMSLSGTNRLYQYGRVMSAPAGKEEVTSVKF
jgi:hypothetical protein